MKGTKSRAKVIASNVIDACYSMCSRQTGATAVEYALLVGFIATVIVFAVGLLGQQVIPGFQAATAGLR